MYLPIENSISDFALAKLGRKQFADTLVTNQRLAKKDNQIVISIDEFRSIVAEAQGFSYDVGLDNCSVAESKKLSDTYINNLLSEKV